MPTPNPVDVAARASGQIALHRIRSAPWAMLQSAFPAVYQAATSIELAIELDDPAEPMIVSEPPTVDQAAVPRLPKTSGQVAVIQIRGIIGQHGGSDYWGGAYTETIAAQLAQMVASPTIGAIILDIDSPGGIVYGTPELADGIRTLRESKPIYAVANGMAASAAYWIGSAATKLFVIPSGKTGSIGVWSGHVDISEALEKEGIKITLVHAGEYKVEGNPWEPLGEEAQAEMQASADRYYDMFLDGVAANRGATKAVVRESYGKGRLLGAEAAKAAGMVDGIAGVPDVLAGILKPRKSKQRATALGLAVAVAEAE